MANQILTVPVANAYLKQLLETDEVLSDCWIQGEVTERFEARSGHVYFTIVDGQSTLKSVMFRGNALRQRNRFNDGDEVVVHGRLTIYEQRSQYQLIADSVQPAGLGLQALQLELLRQKLEAEGLFDPTRKRPLPPMPRTIGVVTSADGAVWHDIQNVLRRRFPLAHLIISPAQVQGEGAPASLVHALNRMIESGLPDVIIIGRGGGSADDLAAFNDESLVRAIFASPTPIVSAVGHETDWSLTDLVADLRAPTPSAAAELVTPSVDELGAYAIALGRRIRQLGAGEIATLQMRLEHARQSIERRTIATLFDRYRPAIQHATVRIAAAGHTRIERGLSRADHLAMHGRHHWRIAAAAQRSRVERQEFALRSLNPASVMQRGFALVSRTDSGRPIQSIEQVTTGDSATIALLDGEFSATIDSTNAYRSVERT